MRTPFFLLFMLLGSLPIMNAQMRYEKGSVIPSLPVSNTKDETFALYLPRSYEESMPQPILFIYDPMGRGKIGVQPFIEASEKYGLILVCSNDSRNAPYPQNFDISNHLFNHVFSNFNINEDEMFASGFSGGSRLASAIASLTDKFVGVIGCGAGFSGLQEHTPSTQKYAYVGLCGNLDMNYSEMLNNQDYLNLIQFKNTLITYDDDHSWPSAEQIVRAFDWLYLQRTKNNPSQHKNEILSYYQADHDKLQQFLSNQELIFANEQYERMIKDYGSIFSIDSLKTEYRRFKKDKAFKKQAAALEKALKMEAGLFDKFRTRFAEEFSGDNGPDLNWWKKEIGKLDALREKESIEIQKMAGRVKFGVFAMAFERKMVLPKTTDNNLITSLDQLISLAYQKREIH